MASAGLSLAALIALIPLRRTETTQSIVRAAEQDSFMIDQAKPRKFTRWNVAEQVQHIMMTMGSSLSAVAMFNNTSFARIRLVRDADANRERPMFRARTRLA